MCELFSAEFPVNRERYWELHPNVPFSAWYEEKYHL